MAGNLHIWLRFNKYEKHKLLAFKIFQISLWMAKTNFSRRTNEAIIKWTLVVAIISAVVCIAQLVINN